MYLCYYNTDYNVANTIKMVNSNEFLSSIVNNRRWWWQWK